MCGGKADDAGRLLRPSYLKAAVRLPRAKQNTCVSRGLRSAVKAFLTACAGLSTLTQSKSARCALNWKREGVQAAKGHGEGGWWGGGGRERKRKRVNRSVQVGKEKKDKRRPLLGLMDDNGGRRKQVKGAGGAC